MDIKLLDDGWCHNIVYQPTNRSTLDPSSTLRYIVTSLYRECRNQGNSLSSAVEIGWSLWRQSKNLWRERMSKSYGNEMHWYNRKISVLNTVYQHTSERMVCNVKIVCTYHLSVIMVVGALLRTTAFSCIDASWDGFRNIKWGENIWHFNIQLIWDYTCSESMCLE